MILVLGTLALMAGTFDGQEPMPSFFEVGVLELELD
jgi:hypothetical protein